MSDFNTVITQVTSLLGGGGSVDREAGERIVREYIETVGPAVMLLSRVAQWAERGLHVEVSSVVDDYPHLLEMAEQVLKSDLVGEPAGRLQPLVPRGMVMPVVRPEWLDHIERSMREADRAAKSIERHQGLAIGRGPITDRLKALERLIQQEPASLLWRTERGRLEDAALEELRANLLSSHERGDAEGVRRAAAEILRPQWTHTVPADLQQLAQQTVKSVSARQGGARYVELSAEIRDAASRADEQALDRLELEWVRVQQTTGVMPSGELESEVAGAFEWLAKQREARAREQEFEQAIHAFEGLLVSRPSPEQISTGLGTLKAFDRELPPGLEQQARAYLDSIRTAQQRRVVVRIASIVAAVIAVAALVAWQIHAQDRAARAKSIAKEIQAKLEIHAVPEAEKLLAEHADLKSDPDMVKAESDCRNARKEYDTFRTKVQALTKEFEVAVAQPVPPTKRRDLERERKKLDTARIEPDEKAKLEDLERQLERQADAYASDLLKNFREASEPWLERGRESKALDALPESEGYDVARLNQMLEAASAVSGEGAAISQKFDELEQVSSSLMAEHRAELKRLDALKAAVRDRLKAIDTLQSRYRDLLAASGDTRRFLEEYQKLLDDCTATLSGMGLMSGFRNAREMCVQMDRTFTPWNKLCEAFAKEKPSTMIRPLSADQRTMVDEVIAAGGSWSGRKVAEAIRALDEIGNRGGTPVGERLAGELKQRRIFDLKVLPLEDGGWVFRQLSEPDGPWESGVITTRDDVGREPPLNFFGGKPPKALRRAEKSSQTPTSRKVADLEVAIGKLGVRGVRQRFLKCLEEITADRTPLASGNEGSVFRLWVAMQLLEIWQEQLVPAGADARPTKVDDKLQELQRQLRDEHAAAVDFDWGRPVRTKEEIDNAKAKDGNAQQALAVLMEGLKNLVAEDRKLWDAVDSDLQPRKPAGVAGVEPGAKVTTLQDSATQPGVVYEILMPRASGFEVTVRTADDLRALMIDRRFGPVLLFRGAAAPSKPAGKAGK